MTLSEFIEKFGNEADHKGQTMAKLYTKAFKSWIDECNSQSIKEPRVVNLIKHGLTGEDGFFIWSYTDSSSSWVNSDKRNGNEYCSEGKKIFAECLTRALNKIPSFEGIVFRMEESDENLEKFNWFKDNIGLRISIPYFLSTAKEDYDSSPMVWKIQTLNEGLAKDISLISNNQFELEVLFIPDSKFTIIGVEEDNKTVLLKELSLGSTVDLELCRIYYKSEFDDTDNQLGMFD